MEYFEETYASTGLTLKPTVPEISRFYGIIIYMYIDDHNPPHFHVWYNDYEAVITIEEGIVIGSLPRRELKLVYEWLDIHKEELLENWRLLSNFELKIKTIKMKFLQPKVQAPKNSEDYKKTSFEVPAKDVHPIDQI